MIINITHEKPCRISLKHNPRLNLKYSPSVSTQGLAWLLLIYSLPAIAKDMTKAISRRVGWSLAVMWIPC